MVFVPVLLLALFLLITDAFQINKRPAIRSAFGWSLQSSTVIRSEMSFFEESSSETDISDEDDSVEEEEIVDPEAGTAPRDFEKDKANGSSQAMHKSVSLPDLTNISHTTTSNILPQVETMVMVPPPEAEKYTSLASLLFASSHLSEEFQLDDEYDDDCSKYSGSTVSIYNDESSYDDGSSSIIYQGAAANTAASFANILQSYHDAYDELAWEEFTEQTAMEEEEQLRRTDLQPKETIEAVVRRLEV